MPQSAVFNRMLPFRVCLLLSTVTVSVFAQQNSGSLPFVGTDTVTVVDDDARQQVLAGQIERIEGETLTFRRSGQGSLQFIRITDVVELNFPRSDPWENGLIEYREGQLNPAAQLLETALRNETRDWAWVELQATIVKVLIDLGQREWAVDRVEQILKRDARSRHVGLLPLVWDERLPPDERITAGGAELKHSSAVRRLVAASALLHDPVYQDAAKATLLNVRRDARLGRLTDLAEAQLWRMALLDISGKTKFLNVWRDRVRSIDASDRQGPAFVVARCLQKEHLYDQAAVEFLWSGMMSPVDKALAAQALAEAVSCLEAAGQIDEAARIQFELEQRFRKYSAAQPVDE